MLIFYYVGGKFGEVMEVFLAKKHSPDAGVGCTGRWNRASGALSAAGAGVGSTECCPCASGEVSDFGACEPSTSDAGTRRGAGHCLCVQCEVTSASALSCFLLKSTGRLGCVRWLTFGDPTSLQCSLLTSRCAPDASGVD